MIIEEKLPGIIVITGSTCTGKTDLALSIATSPKLKNKVEIVNADAMQIFTHLRIATNKASEGEMLGVPHHLLGTIDSISYLKEMSIKCHSLNNGNNCSDITNEQFRDDSSYHVQQFQRDARKCIEQIRERGKIPILVGGTHYYIRAVIFDDFLQKDDEFNCDFNDDFNDNDIKKQNQKNEIFDEATAKETSNIPTNNLSSSSSTTSTSLSTTTTTTTTTTTRVFDKLNDKLTGKIQNEYGVYNFERLKMVDPLSANKIHPNDHRKIKRCLQVFEKSNGKVTLSEILKKKQKKSSLYYDDLYFFYLDCNQSVLYDRINKRADIMIEKGLLNELKEFRNEMKKNHIDSRKVHHMGVLQCIGYKEFESYMDALDNNYSNDQISEILHKCTENLKQVTRNYARKQANYYNRVWAAKDSPLFSNCNNNLPCRLFTFDVTDKSSFQTMAVPASITIAETLLQGSTSSGMIPSNIIDSFCVKSPLKKAYVVNIGTKRNIEISEQQCIQGSACDTDIKDKWKQRYYCEKCEKFAQGYLEWQQHLHSRLHRKKKKKRDISN